MSTGIYKITSPSGKIYIGQSINIEQRWKNYSLNSKNQIKLFNSFKKYSIEGHSFEVIEKCTVDQLNTRERYWQDYYDVLGKDGLNCILTSTEEKSTVFCEEMQLRKSLAGKNREEKLSDEEVLEICNLLLTGTISSEIMRKFPHVKKHTIFNIKSKNAFKHLTKDLTFPKPSKKGCKRKVIRKVLCVEDNLIFDGIYAAARYYKITHNVVSRSAIWNRKCYIDKTFKYIKDE